jgi:hypothetical protein
MGQMALQETRGSRRDIGLWRGQMAIERVKGVEGAERHRENKGHRVQIGP